MRALIQKVSEASVTVEAEKIANIGHGLLVLLGIEDADTDKDIEWLCNKIVQLRIFDDEHGVMNRSIIDQKGEIIVVSQFTLMAKTKGNHIALFNKVNVKTL